MIARLHGKPKFITPQFSPRELRTESDVEQKLLFPFLTNASYLNIRTEWVRTKEYMTPTEVDKAAGKRFGYFPDYSIWIAGRPLAIVEAKGPDIAIEVGLREARLYAGEINKRYPPEVNPIGYVLASNGEQIALSEWDSETNVLIAKSINAGPGTAVFDAIVGAIGRNALEERSKKLDPHFQARKFWPVAASIGTPSKLTRQLGVNEFAEPLFPVLTKYFENTDDTSDDVIDHAYVTSDELNTYEGILETYLKDRTSKIAGNQLKAIETSRTTAPGLTTEVQRFAGNPAYYSRVQLIVGAVGSGKSTFMRRYYRRLMTKEVRDKTLWSFVNFNATGPELEGVTKFIAEQFLQSFGRENQIDIYDLETVQRIFSAELNRFERGPAKMLVSADRAEYVRKRTALLESLMADPIKFTEAIARHYSGERHLGLVVLFDNVDKRTREQQLKVFEAAQWFKDITKGLILVNLRDSTFEAHKDEPPLDAFINAINFYIKPPRFAPVIRKRLELVLENLTDEIGKKLEYSLTGGQRITYPASRLGEFLMSVYASLFDNRETQIASSLEALVAKDVRRALGMFSDIIISPHIQTNQITGAAIVGKEYKIPERHILRALMRGRYALYANGHSSYIHDILGADESHVRPSNFIFCDILEYLIRKRKDKIDFFQEGYATIGTLIQEMSRLGYDEGDTYKAVMSLVTRGLVEPEGHIMTDLLPEDAVRVHASGFVHDRMLLRREEYVTGITSGMKFAARDVADDIARQWVNADGRPEMSVAAKFKILEKMREYFRFEYARRCRRHPFYEEAGFGGRHIVKCIEHDYEFVQDLLTKIRPVLRRPGYTQTTQTVGTRR
ncbi:hypothetical protein [Mesorhizobium sp. M00.F.Ca.ET.216.01.1.1]|uniref:hypothetical protein n=1 Tax=Mesorhizobium sp. M00.F.Ca.ET.216.01.1.1 TaxID=2500528 RepID=UPI000FD6C90E|nr:hypothetical protein [Mesorhizobium sp. M00.F.Ca.ET.216.01.1.1]TGQ41174.1 hypothetical protein EN859_012540 [Mesorhizobium sp. M00.F.Ca.ET.216.01.1.1]